MDSKDAKRWHVMYVCCKQCTVVIIIWRKLFVPTSFCLFHHWTRWIIYKADDIAQCVHNLHNRMGIGPLSKPDDTNSASQSQNSQILLRSFLLSWNDSYIFQVVSFEFSKFEWGIVKYFVVHTYLAGEGDTSTLKYKNKWHKATWSLPYFKRWWWMFTNACRFLHGSCWDEKLLLGPLHRNKRLGVSNNSLEKSIWHKTHSRWRHLSKLKNVSPLVRHFHGLFSRHVSLFIYR